MTSDQLEQRRAALLRANVIRKGNADAKRELKSYELTFGAALERDSCQSAAAFDLLLALPGVGRIKALKVMRTLGVAPSKRVDGLTDRQRTALIGWARPYQHPRKLGGPQRQRLAA